MPTENEVTSLLNNLVLALKKLEDVRDMVQHNRIQNERARDSGNRKPEDEDVFMYGDGIKPPYAMNEVKKRRGVSFLVSMRSRNSTAHGGANNCPARGSSRTVPQLQQN
jgi:hypothetical protein